MNLLERPRLLPEAGLSLITSPRRHLGGAFFSLVPGGPVLPPACGHTISLRRYWQQKSKKQGGIFPAFFISGCCPENEIRYVETIKGPRLLERGPSCRIKPRTARWLEVRGEELAVDGLEVVLQQLFAGIKGSAHDGDDTAELAVGAEVADAFDLLLGKFSHVGIAGSHRFRDRETGSLHIGKGLGRKIFGGKGDRSDGHSNDGLFSGVLEDGHGSALGRLDRLGLGPAGGQVQRKVIGLHFSSQRHGCAKKDAQKAGCRKRQDFLHMILLKV